MLSTKLLSTQNIILVYVAQNILKEGVKNCSSLARDIDISHDRFNRLLEEEEKLKCEFSSFAIRVICEHIIKEKGGGNIGVDDTHISKRYSQNIVGVTEVYNTLDKRYEKCLCVMTIFWTNGKITIPFAWLPYYGKEVPVDLYETKISLAKKLISFSIKEKIPFESFVADGAFATENLMRFLIAKGMTFFMRTRSTMVITTASGSSQLKKHQDLKMRGRQKCKDCTGSWHGMELHFVAEKRTDIRNPRTVFLVHNSESTAFSATNFYRLRWEVEKMHRSIKQKLGFCDCQSRIPGKQFAHIHLVFISYIFLQKIKYAENSKSICMVVNRLRDFKRIGLITLEQFLDQLNQCYA